MTTAHTTARLPNDRPLHIAIQAVALTSMALLTLVTVSALF
ncbi:hypothetical protein HNQ51_002381 [Inhella inkyongensis]|uniref:Uncharacterized protein n=1 Tax=Inhella inkyongensis TaxID=392593 RepID=A0A840S653_9BURK|nr:hypothetical protein [Inhella inkyongensis]MBB5205062.1 hypothetical protein [Inhella inkyongensis]